MLEIIWLCGFTCLSVIFCVISVHADRTGGDAGQYQLLAHGSLVMALAVSWNGPGSHFYQWLLQNLPQYGSDINNLTALFVVAVAGFVFVAGLPFALLMGGSRVFLAQHPFKIE